MIQDGMGYGCSNYWRMTGEDLAEANGEFCPCWYETIPKIKFSEDGKYNLSIECAVKKLDCKEGFPETNADLTQIFMLFHKAY